MTDITVPGDLWDSEDEGVIFSWLYADGALVAETVVRKGAIIGRIEAV
jgi:hypothetical protein